jgi:hypothetical protein
MRGEVKDWFERSLLDNNRKWFVAGILEKKLESARPLLIPLLHAAMSEPDPSTNRAFLRSFKKAGFTWEHVLDPMLHLADEGDATMRGGVARCCYWLGSILPGTTKAVIIRLNSWKLKTFLHASDLYELRSLIPSVCFDTSRISPEEHELIPLAIAKASNHPDEYIRHRMDIHMGRSSGPYQALLPEELPTWLFDGQHFQLSVMAMVYAASSFFWREQFASFCNLL